MYIKIKKYKLFGLLALIGLCSCSMDETPQSSVDKQEIFDTEKGLEAYSYSFYNMLPSVSDAYKMDEMCDYGAVSNYDNFIRKNAYNATVSSGWNWSDLRNINYFIENCVSDKLSAQVKTNYIALARFFRAYFYFHKVIRFGDVPWIDHTLQVDSPELYAARDSRTLVMDKVLEDLDAACEGISRTADESGTMITKWVAYAFKSRVCLFEGTFRKYHTELHLQDTADKWLEEACSAAETVMKQSGHALYNAEGVDKSFRALFINDKPKTEEILLACCASSELGILGSANWWWTSGTYGLRFSMIRPFINLFLMKDGSPFTDKPNYDKIEFYEECQDRDARLAQTIRTPGYQIDGKFAAPNFNGYSYTGYQPIKYTLDSEYYNSGSLNTNAIPLFRYAEVLLNYAEAKAELGSLTDSDWEKTIGALRSRAGITSGLHVRPTRVDPYIKNTYFPNISDPVLLEIRRERSVELALEGFRFNDLLRWKCGELMEMKWTGIYVPAVNTPLDLDHDGTMDVVFYTGSKPQNLPVTCAPIQIGGENSKQGLTETDKGNLTWYADDTERVWYDDGRQYYYPIPKSAINLNPNLIQNPVWTN